jgi:hypothetical protein
MKNDPLYFELARQAWQRCQPSDAEVALCVRRIQLAKRARAANPSSPAWAWLLVLLGLLGAGLAWAYVTRVNLQKSPGYSVVSARSTNPMKPRETPSPAVEAPANTQPEVASRPAWSRRRLPPVSSARAASSATAGMPRPDRVPLPVPDRAPWRTVDAALRAHDLAGARAALEQLGQSADTVVAAKAKLGLAQLSVRQGDCEGARRVLGELEQAGEVPAQILARARQLGSQCP